MIRECWRCGRRIRRGEEGVKYGHCASCSPPEKGPWGVYPHAEWVHDHVETTGRGYVVRELTRAVPYGRMHPLRVFSRRKDADAMADRLTFRDARDARRGLRARQWRRRS